MDKAFDKLTDKQKFEVVIGRIELLESSVRKLRRALAKEQKKEEPKAEDGQPS